MTGIKSPYRILIIFTTWWLESRGKMFLTRSITRPLFRSSSKGLKFKPLGGNREKFYTTSQLAKRWGVSSMTVMRLIEQGDLNGLKIRGSYRIRLTSVKEYEEKVAF